MNNRWKQITRLFTKALKQDEADRAVWLEEACGGDRELYEEVDSLVRAYTSPGLPGQSLEELRAMAFLQLDEKEMNGKQIGPFHLQELIGAGGMGVVYRARDTRLERDVAIKFPPPAWSLNEHAKQRFLQEARSAASLDHPNVCTIYETGEMDNGSLYMAMAYYQGKTLQQRLEKGPLPVDEALNIALQTARGLDSAHGQGLVHRDIKPANLMITPGGTLKILDFGIAKVSDAGLTAAAQRPGTAAYMAPEQARGEDVDSRADLWALGLVLYEMLTGQRPSKNPEAPSVKRTEVSKEIDDLVLWLLEPHPDDRPGKAGDVIRLLELPERGKIAGNHLAKKVLLMAGIPTLLLIMFLSILLTMNRNNRDLAELVENQRIAVIPFSNQTGDPSLEQIGDIAGSWISNQISDLEGVQTVPYFTTIEYLPYMGILPNDPQNRPTFREVVGARYFITGNYYLRDQHLYFDVQLTDAHTQELTYNLPVVEGPKDSVMYVIEDLRLNIAGLITNLDEVRLGKLHPPNYEAYTYYLKGLNELKIGLHRSNTQQYFEKAVELEPEFVMANVFLIWSYTYEKEKWGSILQRMGQFQNMTNYETSAYLKQYHKYKRNYKEALKVTLRILDEYPQDYYFNIEAAHLAKSLFFPELAIQLLSQLHDPLASDVGLLWHYFKMWNYTESLMMLGRYEEALAYLESIPVEFHNPSIPTLFIFVHIKMGMTRSEVEALIDGFAGNDMTMFAEYFTIAAYEFGLLSETEASRYFAGKAIELFQTIPGNKGEFYDLADALYLSGDLEGARAFLKQQLEKEPESSDLLVYLAQVEAASGNRSEAERIFAKLGERPHIPIRRFEYKYHRDYLKARMYAQLGEIDEAVELIRSALVKGQLRHHIEFERDIFLKPLFGHPEFQALVEPRKHEEITAVP